ncbi:MAG: AAA family ATPase [Hyphomicrobiaceae bacterium]
MAPTTKLEAASALPHRAVPNGPSLTQLAGMNEARAWGLALAQDIKLFREKKLAWSEVDPGCILHGPPGTGKTTFAKALAATCGLPLVTAGFGIWQSSNDGHLGDTLSAMQKTFAEARDKAPCILFIDELDSIPSRSTSNRSAEYWIAVTNALLKEIDALSDIKGVVVIGACNYPDRLDSALTRSGRMDRMIAVTLPNVRELQDIITYHIAAVEKVAKPEPSALRSAAVASIGLSGADVEKTVRIARRKARCAGEPFAMVYYMAALEDQNSGADPDTLLLRAFHEAGHAIAALRLHLSSDINVSIIARGSAAGISIPKPGFLTPSDAADQLVMFLAGRAAEHILLGEITNLSGGHDQDCDLARATRLATDIVARYGFHHTRGLFWVHPNASPGAKLEREVQNMLDRAYAAAIALVRNNALTTSNIARELYRRRALTHQDMLEIEQESTASLPGYPPPYTPRQSLSSTRPIPRASTRLRARPDPGPPGSPYAIQKDTVTSASHQPQMGQYPSGWIVDE